MFLSKLSSIAQTITRMIFLNIYFNFVYKVTTISHVELDPKQNYLFVSNHRSLKDPPLLGHSTKRNIAFVAKKELFVNPILRMIITAASAISINREKVEVSTMKKAKQALNTDGWSSGIFIEGTRSKIEGELGQPNPGPIYIAKLAKAPIVPVGITYTNSNKIRVEIGEPYSIDPKRDLDEQAWECLEKISKLCDYSMPQKD